MAATCSPTSGISRRPGYVFRGPLSKKMLNVRSNSPKVPQCQMGVTQNWGGPFLGSLYKGTDEFGSMYSVPLILETPICSIFEVPGSARATYLLHAAHPKIRPKEGLIKAYLGHGRAIAEGILECHL